MHDMISWFATAATIIAALMTASNLGSRVTGYGFAVFLVGSLAWIAAASMSGDPALMWSNIVLSLLNLFGIWRWLGRQGRIEEGEADAAQRSRAEPGETLFPVSLLSKAKLAGSDGTILGHGVDAMAGCSNGSIRYLVVSEGGIAGVGETLRRLDWTGVRVDGDTIRCSLDAPALCALDPIEADHWPAR
jgi:membrane protein implicated in regulation of membrane protease activity